MTPAPLVLASQNPKKSRELDALLRPLGWQVQALSGFTADSPVEDAPTFVENALIKARHAARISGLPAIADDSGLEVAALGGAPGVRSARYAGEPSDDAANNRRLLAALSGVPAAERGARFVCALVLLRHADDPVPVIAVGTWPGQILDAPRGDGGFGYDPLFLVPERQRSAAELGADEKARLSHRGRALRSLMQQLAADAR
ncbi:MAG: RdgB/HAM1 family non-canonical purine NTP pyrophosphatase [Polycyclovorans sp.]|jgi:XTP/dITP diphosphohydrolase|nr:non-canonical purine NTP pyrophosphatase, RdgB/HAM1 family [Polycyclovorans sp.]MBU0790750.1 RdgB/HAM1 family non-canonical purine NTP pyrophosphatase [Gammaproteobacteria bacterium]MDP1541991.1 RdgB/HAM1 family non-canonical purine NTP pyrophosphatase [Polycyclovorans sp.]MEC8849481.1 RdgB/HAM1 family non-canonical purine NTP pyrophosphatase [Pseudomonadota bacterium]|tara:strand:- start:1940 stop:2545 length:606 start_codon:yes stop_codon:yes gene_type:complete